MIPVERKVIKPTTQALLHKRRSGASGLPARSDKIAGKWDYFLSKAPVVPQANQDALKDVRDTLDNMFHGKCCYCEKILAKDIEHFYPKTLYPQKMFEWENLLRACKDCNFEKLDEDPEDPKDPNGQRSLLDPTVDRPEDYLSWDLLTGMPVPKSQAPNHRGERTVQVCDLRNQKFNEERRKKATRVNNRLIDAVKDTQPDPKTVEELEDELAPGSPYLGVVRQILLDPLLSPLIDDVLARLPQLQSRVDALRWTHP